MKARTKVAVWLALVVLTWTPVIIVCLLAWRMGRA